MNDTLVRSSNNTDNIMQLITSFIENNYNKDALEKSKDDNYESQNMFSNDLYKDIEYLFFNYVYSVESIFENTVRSSLDDYIKKNKFFLIILLEVFCITMIIYNITYIVILTPKLVHLMNISRGVIKIIPTSVIMNTPELQALIGSKYSKY
jgi:hypothetical protein